MAGRGGGRFGVVFEGEGGDWSLARLIRELARIDGLERLRFTTSHPNDMSDDLIAAHGEVDKLMPYLHLPVQSGSDRILMAMKRGHSAFDYKQKIGRLREVRPDISISSDFIVGFPGESGQDFEHTIPVDILAVLGVRLEDREDDVLLARTRQAFHAHGLGQFDEFVLGIALEIRERHALSLG